MKQWSLALCLALALVLTACAGGVAAAVFFALIAALLFRSRDKS